MGDSPLLRALQQPCASWPGLGQAGQRAAWLTLQPCLEEAVDTPSLCQPLIFTRRAGADCLGDFCCPVRYRSRGLIATQRGWQTDGQAAGGPPKPHFLGKSPDIFSLLKLPKLLAPTGASNRTLDTDT